MALLPLSLPPGIARQIILFALLVILNVVALLAFGFEA